MSWMTWSDPKEYTLKMSYSYLDVGAWSAELAQVPDHFWVVGPARACWELKGGLLVRVNNEGHLVGAERTA